MGTKTYYQICLDLTGRLCLVVGGGAVGERKVLGLLEAGARVRLVCPSCTPTLGNMAASGAVEWIADSYRSEHGDGVSLVIGATNDRTVNERIAEDARRRGLEVNIVDMPDLCSFIVPALHRMGPLQIAVSSGGASPVIAGRVRDRIKECVGEEYAVLAEFLRVKRERLRTVDANRKHTFWQSVRTLDMAKYVGRHDELGVEVDRLLEKALRGEDAS